MDINPQHATQYRSDAYATVPSNKPTQCRETWEKQSSTSNPNTQPSIEVMHMRQDEQAHTMLRRNLSPAKQWSTRPQVANNKLHYAKKKAQYGHQRDNAKKKAQYWSPTHNPV